MWMRPIPTVLSPPPANLTVRAVDSHSFELIREAGDVFSALFHLANRRGWTHEMLTTAAIEKLRERFD